MNYLIEYLNRQNTAFLTFLSLVCVFIIGFFDYITGVEISLAVFYLLPIAFAAWFVGNRVGILIGIAGAVTWLIAEMLRNAPYSNPAFPYLNAVLKLGIFMIVVVLISKIRTFNEHLEQKIEERTTALIEEVRERKLAERTILTYQKNLQMLMQRLSLLEEQKKNKYPRNCMIISAKPSLCQKSNSLRWNNPLLVLMS